MGLFGGGEQKRILKEGSASTAVIREATPIDPDLEGGAEPGESGILSHLPDQLGIGKRRYRMTLDVTPAGGGDPYAVEFDGKVPAKAQWAGLGKLRDLSAGLELPVRIDKSDPARVEIDWDAFLADPGRKDAVRKASSDSDVADYKEWVETSDTGRQLIEGNRQALPVWVQAVKGGSMKRKDFDKTVALELKTGRMDPADAEEAYRQLDG